MRPHVTGSTTSASTEVEPGGDRSGPQLPAIFSRYRSSVERELFRSVPKTNGEDLFFPLRYHLGWLDQTGRPAQSPMSQGKALRPTLCLFACEALEADPDRALPAAAALELIHNFSLIHDDIEDQDLERRHQPTVWYLWGMPRALVAGNGLQSVGDLSLLNVAGPSVPAATALRVSQILTESYVEMIQGQCLDLEFESRTDVMSGDYLQMIAFKTGALIRSGLEIGALLASDDPAAFQAFSRFGSGVGRAFQIRDDYLGIWGDRATTGKAAGNDIRRRKKTFPVVFAMEKTKGPVRQELLRIYGQEELDDDDVGRVLAILDEAEAQQHSHEITQASAGEALDSLASLPLPGWAMAEAQALVDFLANREY